jgi:hypothetical protein
MGLKGDTLSGMTFWHGNLLNEWATRWVQYWTDGKGRFVTSAKKDTGTFQSLTYLHATGKVDKNRVMVLRTASNYTTPPPGMTAAEHLLKESEGSMPACMPQSRRPIRSGRRWSTRSSAIGRCTIFAHRRRRRERRAGSNSCHGPRLRTVEETRQPEFSRIHERLDAAGEVGHQVTGAGRDPESVA